MLPSETIFVSCKSLYKHEPAKALYVFYQITRDFGASDFKSGLPSSGQKALVAFRRGEIRVGKLSPILRNDVRLKDIRHIWFWRIAHANHRSGLKIESWCLAIVVDPNSNLRLDSSFELIKNSICAKVGSVPDIERLLSDLGLRFSRFGLGHGSFYLLARVPNEIGVQFCQFLIGLGILEA